MNNITTECFKACEIEFVSSGVYNAPEEFDVLVDCIFTNEKTGAELNVPAFFDGENVWRVRFAPTQTGTWNFVTRSEDAFLNGIAGKVECKEYTGDLLIYKHGFIKPCGKYFVYNDGTPFFYLGDTHWTVYGEEFNGHFDRIVDKRVSQGYTVYQTEPLGMDFKLEAGLSHLSLPAFKKADKYYKYIAEKGLVHANASFFFPTVLTNELATNEEYLKKLARYWVARFGAYPVLWTVAQEVDNGGYNKHGEGDEYAKNNPWVKIAEYIHLFDPYKHPLTAHQLATDAVTVTGAGTKPVNADLSLNTRRILNGRSSFDYEEKENNNFRTGHNWWASQWKMELNKRINVDVAKDYYFDKKPAVNYESRYCRFQTLDAGARIQGWISILSGMCGYGYGAEELWAFNNKWLKDNIMVDGIDTVFPCDKYVTWQQAMELESGYQAGYMKSFFEKLEWQQLVPDFYDENKYCDHADVRYVCAAKDDEIYVIYFYGGKTPAGKIRGLDKNATYTFTHYNPVTDTYYEFSNNIVPDENGEYAVPNMPSTNPDWVILFTKNR